jgi:hypothetical protein
MRTPTNSRRAKGKKVKPGREHWWWQKSRLKRALKENRHLDHFFYWRVKGRKSPFGTKWTRAQRQAIETALWLYELDARISGKYLFGQPAYRLERDELFSVVTITHPSKAPSHSPKAGAPRRSFAWEWIEYFDKRDDKRAPKLTRSELNGMFAAMKHCMDYFLHG